MSNASKKTSQSSTPKGFTKTTINMPTPIHRELKKSAKAADRSVSGQVVSFVKDGLGLNQPQPEQP